MPVIPPFLLKKLYVQGSLRNEDEGIALDLKNPIAPGTIQGFKGLELDGQEVAVEHVTIVPPEEAVRPAAEISAQTPLAFPMGVVFTLRARGVQLDPGAHSLAIRVVVQDVGPLEIPVADQVS